MTDRKPLKSKKCRNCKGEFQPRNSLQVCCSIPCGVEYTRTKQEKASERRTRALQAAERKDIAERRERLRTRSDHLALAQMAFNKFIRLRDKDELCISCGRRHSGQYHAGHYRSVGACPELRFTENNVHKQCSPCNNHKSGNPIEYRLRLIEKIGLEAVEALEGPHPPLKLTIPEIIEIKKKYAKLARKLQIEDN